MSTNRINHLKILASLVFLLIAILIVIYVTVFFLHRIPIKYAKFVDAGVIALVSYLILKIITLYVNDVLLKYLDRAKVHPFVFMINMVGYFVIALAVVASLGIDVSSLILGSTFLAAVLGLAAQSVLSNQFSGLLIIITKPFKIGDRVWIHVWQFSIAYGVIVPKYFSSDFLYNNGFLGVIEDISINFTTLRTDGGEIVKIANNVLTQGAFRLITDTPIVQVRYEIPKYLDISQFRDEITQKVSTISGIDGDPVLNIDETTLNTYVIMVKAKFRGTTPEVARSKIIENIIRIVEPKRFSSASLSNFK
jgi:small-conductance mechanosensitive channel